MNNWFVYTHTRLDTNAIFYIGIGCNKARLLSKRSRNPYWKNIVKVTAYEATVIMEGLSKGAACEKEKEFIALYGRKDIGTGFLANMTDGGEGSPGMCEESKNKIRLANTGKKMPEEVKAKLSAIHKGKKQSQEFIKKRTASFLGMKRTEETKNKMSKAQAGKKKKKWSEQRRTEWAGRPSNAKGKKWSEESRARFSESKKGCKISAATTQKIADALRGRKQPEELKKRWSELARLREARHKLERMQKQTDARH